MSTIPVSLTEKQFDAHIRPYISTAKRGFESKIPLFQVFNDVLYRLHTGCQWYQLPIAALPSNPDKKEISYDAVYYHLGSICRKHSNRSNILVLRFQEPISMQTKPLIPRLLEKLASIMV